MPKFSPRPHLLAASVLVLSSVLAGCGGGSDGSDNEAPVSNGAAPSGETAPSTSNSSSSSSTSTPSRTPATGSSSAGNTSTGSNASGSTNTVTSGNSAASPQSGMQVMVPAYFMPDEGWDDIVAGARSYPGVQITAILNPSNGIFSKANADFTQAMDDLAAQNGRVIGYVSTDYGNRSLSEVKANIDNYLTHYPKVNGFFLDEMAAKTNMLSFYQQVYDYIKSKGSNLQVVGNPGSFPHQDYAQVSDVLVTFEGLEVNYRDINPKKDHAWVYNQPATAQSMLVHDAYNCSAMQDSLEIAKLPDTRTGVVYVTDLNYNPSTGVGNPWATLPSYWNKLLASVQAINQGQAMPAC